MVRRGRGRRAFSLVCAIAALGISVASIASRGRSFVWWTPPLNMLTGKPQQGFWLSDGHLLWDRGEISERHRHEPGFRIEPYSYRDVYRFGWRVYGVWWVAAAFAGFACILRLPELMPTPRGCCSHCRYDLRGLRAGTPCPECGAPTPSPQRGARWLPGVKRARRGGRAKPLESSQEANRPGGANEFTVRWRANLVRPSGASKNVFGLPGVPVALRDLHPWLPARVPSGRPAHDVVRALRVRSDDAGLSLTARMPHGCPTTPP